MISTRAMNMYTIVWVTVMSALTQHEIYENCEHIILKCHVAA